MVWPAVPWKMVICELFRVPIKLWGRGVPWGHTVSFWLKKLKLCEKWINDSITHLQLTKRIFVNLVKPNLLMSKTHGFKMSICYPLLGSLISHCCSGKARLVCRKHLSFNLKDEFTSWELFFFLLSSLSGSISDMETQKSVTSWEIKSIIYLRWWKRISNRLFNLKKRTSGLLMNCFRF